jgi:RNA polymerase sigma factor (sigma-70 family)
VPADRADDVVQDSLARALPGIGSGEGDLRLRPWLYTIVRNTALNDLRDAGPPHEQLDENYDGVEQPPQAMERREQVRSLVAGLQGLPEPQREALVKREMEGRSHAEIGAELGVSTGAARQLIFRARNALRNGIGSLIPMPLLRQLAESGDGGGGGTAVAAAASGGGAVGVKAAIALVATGAVVTAGVAIQRDGHHPSASAATRGGAGPAATVRISPGAGPNGGGAHEVADRHRGDSSGGSRGSGGGDSGARHRSPINAKNGVSGAGGRHPGSSGGHVADAVSNDGPNRGSGRGGHGSDDSSGRGGRGGAGNGSGSGSGGSDDGSDQSVNGGESGGGSGPGLSSGSKSGPSDGSDGGGNSSISSEDSSGGGESESGGSRDSHGGEVFQEATDQ